MLRGSNAVDNIGGEDVDLPTEAFFKFIGAARTEILEIISNFQKKSATVVTQLTT